MISKFVLILLIERSKLIKRLSNQSWFKSALIQLFCFPLSSLDLNALIFKPLFFHSLFVKLTSRILSQNLVDRNVIIQLICWSYKLLKTCAWWIILFIRRLRSLYRIQFKFFQKFFLLLKIHWCIFPFLIRNYLIGY